jgi:hypothetical protein
MGRPGRRQSAVSDSRGRDGTRAMFGGAEKGGGPVKVDSTVICEVVAP